MAFLGQGSRICHVAGAWGAAVGTLSTSAKLTAAFSSGYTLTVHSSAATACQIEGASGTLPVAARPPLRSRSREAQPLPRHAARQGFALEAPSTHSTFWAFGRASS